MRRRLVALLPAVALLAALNVIAARGTERTVTTTTTSVDGTKPATGDLVQQGRNLFAAKGCASCHVQLQVGPSLANLKDRAAKTRQGYSAEKYVRESVLAPNAFKADGSSGAPSSEMPTLPVSATELDALVAYLLTL
jgi:cbb3-type cytochrome oxidase cytochrome c subunit